MKRTVNFKRMVAIVLSAVITAAMLVNVSVSAMTYRTLTYTAGNVDNLVGASEVNFEKIVNTTFDTAASSRFSRKGYSLKSWFVPSTGETVGTGAQYVMPNKDITFVANWEPVSYTVTFAGKGGKTSAGLANVTAKATYGTEMVLPENDFVYSGYTFAGWKYSGVTYNAGDKFEVPALLSGSKIVFAAVWTLGSAVEVPVTTAVTTTAAETTTTTTTIATTTTEETTQPTTEATTEATTVETTTTTTTTAATTEETTTTTTTTTAAQVIVSTASAVSGTVTKTFEVNSKVDYTNDSKKMVNVDLTDILAAGKVEAIDISIRSSFGMIGQVVMGIGSNVNGDWAQVDFNENINSKYYTLTINDADFCGNLNGEFLQIGYWYGTTVPLYIDSVTVTYSETAEEVSAPVIENVIGDYNNDGAVTAEDVDALRKFIVGVTVEGFEVTVETADINGDGAVNVFDYMTLSRTIA